LFLLKIIEWLEERAAAPRREAAMSKIVDRMMQQEEATQRRKLYAGKRAIKPDNLKQTSDSN
jgi:hypothetical protein